MSMWTLRRASTVDKTFKKKFGIKLKDAKKLGAGKYGDVYLVNDPDDNGERALKIVKKSKLKDWIDKVFIRNEIELHISLDHPHIVKLYEAFEDKKCHYMVLEIMSGGELFDRIVRDNSFSERKAALITRNCAEALSYLHSKNIVHRDLKPENMLLQSETDDINLKLADFGMAAKCDEPLYTACGTILYIAPEVLQSEPYGTEIDIWSLGVIVYVMLSGSPPFDGNTEEEAMRRIIKGRLGFIGEDWDKISGPAKELVERMLDRDQKKRITAEEILEHPWIKDAEHTPDEQLSSVAQNMRRFKAKQLLKEAFKGIKAVERVRELAKNIKFDDESDEEEEEGGESVKEDKEV